MIALSLPVSCDNATFGKSIKTLRGHITKRGVAVGSGALAAVLAANAVQAAPAGLITLLATSTLLPGGTFSSATTISVTKTLAMSTLQKTLLTTTLIAAVGTAGFKIHQASVLQKDLAAIRQQQVPLEEALARTGSERDHATNLLASLRDENQRLSHNSDELLKLRGEVSRFRHDSEALAALKGQPSGDLSASTMETWAKKVELLKQRLKQFPEANIPELGSLTQEDWLAAAKSDLNTETDYRKALSKLRSSAEGRTSSKIAAAVKKYIEQNGGQLPTDTLQLKSYFQPPLDDAILQRYEIVQADSLPTLTLEGAGEWAVTQKAPVDAEYDTCFAAGPRVLSGGDYQGVEMAKTLTPAIQAYMTANNGNLPSNPQQLMSFATSPDQQETLQKAIKMFEKMSPEERAKSIKMIQRFKAKHL